MQNILKKLPLNHLRAANRECHENTVTLLLCNSACTTVCYKARLHTIYVKTLFISYCAKLHISLC